MEDVLFVAVTMAFFAVAVAYVRLCDRIIGPDPADAHLEPATELRRPAGGDLG